MRRYQAVAMSIVLAVPLWAGVASAQSNKAACDAAKASPQKVEGKVVRVDEAGGKVAVADASGKTLEFQASKETLQDLKVGDRIEAKLRAVPNC
jgi:predicted RNA-binding protein (virulence factor B family)